MLCFKRRALIVVGIVVLVGVATVTLVWDVLPHVFAAPLLQFPINSVTVISDPPPPDLPGQFSEATLLQDNLLDPDPFWRSSNFDDGGWQASYPVVTQTTWGPPVGGVAPPADFIWGGSPGALVGERYSIPSSPDPQFLFLRKNFCIPINASVTSIAVVNPLLLQIAATSGRASVYYNGAPIATNLNGREDGFVYNLTLDSTLVDAVRRVGRNTLATRMRDDVDDTSAGAAYHVGFSYTIDPSAIVVGSNPPSPSLAGTTVIFSQSNNGLSGDGPFTLGWDFGDGTISADSSPAHVYNVPGTYTVTLVMTDSLGCPSAPVSVQYVVQAPTPTLVPTDTPLPPTGTPTPTDTLPPPTDTPLPPPPPSTHTPLPPPPPTDTPLPSPTVTPTPGNLPYLPVTGGLDGFPFVLFLLSVGAGILIIGGFLLVRRYPGLRS